MKKIALSNINALYDEISSLCELYLPVLTAGALNYQKYAKGAKVDLNGQTVKSAKEVFFPQSETFIDFKVTNDNIEIKDAREVKDLFVVFGVRACDQRSFEILDRVFLADPVDTGYQNKREAGVIITLACNSPVQSCFCKNFGIDASSPKGDIESRIANGYLYLEPLTEKGKKLFDKLTVLAACDKADEKAADDNKKEITAKIDALPLNGLDLSEFKGENLMPLFNRPEWDELSEACLGCGTCTFVCPTCQCFDIKDYKTNNGVQRYRCWDSCMYSDFTKMAAANPRTTQMQRYRQRFMHKLVYFPANNDGIYGCVGCGRCVKKCPQSLNIVKVIKKLGGNKND